MSDRYRPWRDKKPRKSPRKSPRKPDRYRESMELDYGKESQFPHKDIMVDLEMPQFPG